MAEDEKNLGQDESEQAPTDYKALYKQAKAEARKWEERSKANKAKADKFDAAAAGEDSLEDRIAKLEAENKAMKDEKKRRALVEEVAAETGLTVERVKALNGADKDSLLAQAKELAEYIESIKPKGAPRAPEAGKFPRGSKSDSDAEMKKFVRDLFGESK